MAEFLNHHLSFCHIETCCLELPCFFSHSIKRVNPTIMLHSPYSYIQFCTIIHIVGFRKGCHLVQYRTFYDRVCCLELPCFFSHSIKRVNPTIMLHSPYSYIQFCTIIHIVGFRKGCHLVQYRTFYDRV